MTEMVSSLVTFLFDKYRSRYDFPQIPRPQPPDVVVEFFKGARGGVFADIGANDGITWSNSLVLEQCLDWKGVCVEPHPMAFDRLKKVRTNPCFQCGALDKSGEINFWKVVGEAEMLSTFESTMDPRHADRIKGELAAGKGRLEIVPIPVRTVTEILATAGFETLDYLSVDTEGSELEVLRGVDFNRYRPTLISCENNYGDTRVEDFLKQHGYRKLGKVCSDEFFTCLS